MTMQEIINKFEEECKRIEYERIMTKVKYTFKPNLMTMFEQNAFIKSVDYGRIKNPHGDYIRIYEGNTTKLKNNSQLLVVKLFQSKLFITEVNPQGIVLCGRIVGAKSITDNTEIVSLDMCVDRVKQNRALKYHDEDVMYQILCMSSLCAMCPENEYVMIKNFGKESCCRQTLIYDSSEARMTLYMNEIVKVWIKVDNMTSSSIYKTMLDMYYRTTGEDAIINASKYADNRQIVYSAIAGHSNVHGYVK